MGELEQVLAQHKIIGVDTAPLIYLWEKHPRYFPLSAILFRYLSRPQIRGVTSVITLVEACIHPQRQGRTDLVRAYTQALLNSKQIQTLPVSVFAAEQAVVLRAEYNIFVPDALQIATALEAGASLFVTNDRRLIRLQEIQILLFDDYAS